MDILDSVLSRLTASRTFRKLWRRFPKGSIQTRMRYGIASRPHYLYCVYSAASLARDLGLEAISVLEFGVAGGNGLVALEEICSEVGGHFGIRIDVVGFDSGEGMPGPRDYRDVAHAWSAGDFAINVEALRSRISGRTELVLGDVAETASAWAQSRCVAPIGFASFDLDYYTSTRMAFSVFDAGSDKTRLPRVYCYFDDIMWPEYACHNPYLGELCAIREFNEEHDFRKICPIHMLRHMRMDKAPWHEQIYVMHDFRHPLYTRNIARAWERQLPLL
jgi:hypothetical protein